MVPCPGAADAMQLLLERPHISFGIRLTLIQDSPGRPLGSGHRQGRRGLAARPRHQRALRRHAGPSLRSRHRGSPRPTSNASCAQVDAVALADEVGTLTSFAGVAAPLPELTARPHWDLPRRAGARSDRRSHPTAHRPFIWSTSSTATQCTRDRSARGEANRGCNRRTPRHRIRHSSNHGDEAPAVSRDNTARAPVDLTRSPVIEVRPLCQRAIAIRSGPGGRFAPRVVDQFRSCRVHDR